jgi:glycosyltransferase involved in cell wall biosynthesis
MRKSEMAPSPTAIRSILVGTNHRDYNSIRNFSGLSSNAFSFKKTYDLLTLPRFLLGKVPIRLPDYARRVFGTLHCDFGLFGVQVMHLFNAVSVSRTPWVVTFEHAVPLWNLQSRFGFRLLAGPRCKKVIAMSQCANDIECHYLNGFPELEGRIRDKMVILHPPQEVNLGDVGEKPRGDGAIRMTIVGHLFYLKGGREILLALDRLVREGEAVKLNIVSLMQRDTYAARPTDEDVRLVRELLERLRLRIRHYPQLTNRQVIDLYRNSDLGLLPSYAETYGYSVLEAQSCGSFARDQQR